MLQLVFGGLAAAVYVWPSFLAEILPFNILRMVHTNALLGFFGAGYYLIPEETEREIESPLLAYVQLGLFVFAAAAAVVGYLFGIHEGREFLEQPLWVKIAIVVVALIYLYNVSMTALKGRRTAVTSAPDGFRFDREGRYHHLFDPRTGLPAARHASVTVLAPDATTADALATAFALMPAEAIERVLV